MCPSSSPCRPLTILGRPPALWHSITRIRDSIQLSGQNRTRRSTMVYLISRLRCQSTKKVGNRPPVYFYHWKYCRSYSKRLARLLSSPSKRPCSHMLAMGRRPPYLSTLTVCNSSPKTGALSVYSSPGGFKRTGRFKKASNMNYGLDLSF